MYNIRLVTEDDIPRILEIENEAFSPPWTHGSLLGEIYRDDSFFAVVDNFELRIPNSGLTIVVDDSELRTPNSGFISGFVILRRMGDDGELLQVAVVKSARRNGIAGVLLDAALLHARENEMKSVFLEVRRGNDAAVSLYKKHGFKTVRRRKGYYSDPVEDACVMAIEL